MNHFLVLLQAVLPVFMLLSAGGAVRAAGWLRAEADATLLRLTVNFFYPCLILSSVIGNRALDDQGALMVAPLTGLMFVLTGFGLSFLVGRMLGLSKPALGTFAFTAGLYNYGFIAIPLAQKLFSESTVGVLFLHNLGVELGIWTFGVALFTGGMSRGGWKSILNAPVISILAGTALHLMGAGRWMPDFILIFIKMVGAASIPMGVLLSGAMIFDLASKRDSLPGWKTGVGGTLLRLGILPLICLFAAKSIPFTRELKEVLIIQAAMPAGMLSVVLARHYRGDASVAMQTVILTNLIGVLSIPLWIQLGRWWVLGE